MGSVALKCCLPHAIDGEKVEGRGENQSRMPWRVSKAERPVRRIRGCLTS